jgi:hypothetical protein
VNLYAGITAFGITKPQLVTGTTGFRTDFKNKEGKDSKNITQAEYAIVLDTLAKEGKRIFNISQSLSQFTLQQDNDPAHKAAQGVIDAWNDKNPGTTIKLLPQWPPNSPDLNPIENLWAWAQAEVDRKGCETFDEYKQCVQDTLQNVPLSVLKGLVGSMKRRIQACINNNGGKTKY